MLHRILGGQHHERLRQRVGLSVNGELGFLHGLQQTGLGLGTGTVDFIGQHDLRHETAEADLPLPRFRIEGRIAGHIRGQQVGGELDAGAGAVQRAGQRRDQRGLSQTGHILDQHMTAADQRQQQRLRLSFLADDHLCNIVLDFFHQCDGRHGITALSFLTEAYHIPGDPAR